MFDVGRFRRLLAVHWAEHGRAHLWFLAIGIGVHFCVWLLVTTGGTDRHGYAEEIQAIVFVAGYILSSLLFTARFHAGMGRRESALTLLMRPASSQEKALLAFLMVAVFYPLAYVLAFQVCNVPGALLGEAARDALVNAKPDDNLNAYLKQRAYGPFLPFVNDNSPWLELDLYLGVAGLQALVLAGALYFQRIAWLKTLVAMFVLLVIALPLLAVATDANPGQLFWVESEAGPTPLLLAWKCFIWLGVLGLLWASTWLLLRDREIQ